MTRHIVTTLTLGLALAGGCARTSADDSRAVQDPATPAAEPTSTGARALTVTGINVDPELARTCGMATPKAFFEYDSTQVEGADNSGLEALAVCVTTGPLKDRRLELVGHADPRGTDAYNAQLGRSRADSVHDFLVTQGVAADRMTARSEGERGTDPADASAWPYDRRVDIRLAQ